jgi:5-methyltetrahydrofolate--homocysteine methyltransferase
MRARAVWRFFPAEADGDRVTLRDPGTGEPVAAWDFPRQAKNGGLCLADYVLPGDHIALFVTTAGGGVRERVEEWKHQGEYLKSHAFAALALETAEAAAEWLHACLRKRWGFPDPADLAMEDQLAARYRGKRYSFGYPACPDLEDRAKIVDLLEPERIGVKLSEEFQLHPEQSTDALIAHHPEAKHFNT